MNLEQINTWTLLVQLWPIVVSIAGAIGFLSLALYRIKVLYRVVFNENGTLSFYTAEKLDRLIKTLAEDIRKDVNGARASIEKDLEDAVKQATIVSARLDKDEETYLTQKEHTSLCTIAQLETAKLVAKELTKAQQNLAEMLATHQTQMLGAIRGILKSNGFSDPPPQSSGK